MFKKQHKELTEADLIRLALRDKEVKIQVYDKDGRSWILETNTANESQLVVRDISVKDGKNIVTSFSIRATNGRMGY